MIITSMFNLHSFLPGKIRYLEDGTLSNIRTALAIQKLV